MEDHGGVQLVTRPEASVDSAASLRRHLALMVKDFRAIQEGVPDPPAYAPNNPVRIDAVHDVAGGVAGTIQDETDYKIQIQLTVL